MTPLPPGTRVGQYEILGHAGTGGMGAVYRAHQLSLNRQVALKTLPEEYQSDNEFRQRFLTEGLAIAKLRHPNIVAAFDFAEYDGVPYLVSEFVDGGTLAEQMGAPLPFDYTVSVLAPVASALDYAHSRGIVHRDVKPNNILIARDGTPILIDFGLAKMVGGMKLTRTGGTVGTLQYVSPESVKGEDAGPASDQYALGIIAYEMLTGHHPFGGESPVAMMFAHLSKPIPSPSTLGISLPPGAEAALMRVLAKEPADRFPSAAAFVRALRGEPVAAPSVAPATPQPAVVAVAPTVVPTTVGATTPPPPMATEARRFSFRVAASILAVVALVPIALVAPRVGSGPAEEGPAPTVAVATPAPAIASATVAPTAPPTASASIAPSPSATTSPPTETAKPAPTAAPTEAPTIAPRTAPPTAPPATLPPVIPTPVPTPTVAPEPERAAIVSSSAARSLTAGSVAQCSVTYQNVGPSTWTTGTPKEVALQFSPNTAAKVVAWVRRTAAGNVADQAVATVAPGQELTFTFSYSVGVDTPTGAYWIYVRPVLGGGAIGPDGSCQVNATAAPSSPNAPDPATPEEP